MKPFEKPTHPSHWSNHYGLERFQKGGLQTLETLTEYLRISRSQGLDYVLPSKDPNARLEMWRQEMQKGSDARNGLVRGDLLSRVLERSNHLHDPRYAGHQVAVPLPELGVDHRCDCVVE